jgi:hypothetical protein
VKETVEADDDPVAVHFPRARPLLALQLLPVLVLWPTLLARTAVDKTHLPLNQVLDAADHTVEGTPLQTMMTS